ncbi:hypothetical protein Tco_1449453 [Tanacetum coccineum]
MGDENPIRTLGDYSKPSHEDYRNTIELLVGNNVVPLQSDTIRLVQNGCSFHGLQSEDLNQHLKDFLKLVAIGLNVFQQDPSLHGRILLHVSLLNSFHREGPRTIDQSADGKLRDLNAKESWALLEDLALYDNESQDGVSRAVTIHPKQKSESLDDKPEENREEEKKNLENIHANPFAPPDPSILFITEIVLKLNSFFESLGLVPQSSNTKLVCTKGDDDDVMYIEIVKTDDDSHKEEPKAGEQEVEYFDIIPTRIKLAYHKYLMCGPIPSIFLRNPIITKGCLSNLKIP